jgi:TPR repeat protein
MKWYQRAIEGGSLTAMVNVAKMYYFGIGVARSYPDAAKWFQIASARGSAAAMNSLGLMYDAGLGVTQDPGTASTLLRRAAGLGMVRRYANPWADALARDREQSRRGLCLMNAALLRGFPQAGTRYLSAGRVARPARISLRRHEARG